MDSTPAMRSHFQAAGARALAALSALALTLTLIPPAAAAEISDGVAPSCDEAYYATLDYYGNLTEGSVVKTYALNGAETLTDYGDYDRVVNLTDGTEPASADGKTTFSFGADAPARFCFEGKTSRPFETLPWTLSLSYTLNGVPVKAEELAGKTGEVEITVNAVPNQAAGDYEKNNYTLEAMAVFNQNDILSLRAEGAQVQLVGNLRIVLFLALPGEEQHFTIRVGADSFAFDGMTFLMVPATLSQLSEISRLGQKKDELESDYDRLSGSIDTMLSAVSGMSGSLYETAQGLDELNDARGAVSAGKGEIYAGADSVLADLNAISGELEPVSGQIDAAGRALTETRDALQVLTASLTALKSDLDILDDDLEQAQTDARAARRLKDDAAAMKADLAALQQVLLAVKTANGALSAVSAPFGGMTTAAAKQSLDSAKSLEAVYNALGGNAKQADGVTDRGLGENQFLSACLLAGEQATAANVGAVLSQLLAVYAAYPDCASKEEVYAAAYAAAKGQGADDAAAGTAAGQAAAAWASVSLMRSAFAAAGGADNASLDLPHTFYGVMLVRNAQLTEGRQTQQQVKDAAEAGYALYDFYRENPAMCNLLVGQMDQLQGQVSGVNASVSGANALLTGLSGPGASLCGKLSALCGDLDTLDALANDGDDLLTLSRAFVEQGRQVLASAEALDKLVNTYEPTAQEALKTAKALTVSAASTVQDTGALFSSLEALSKKAGAQLDGGTEKTLTGLAATLRKAAESLSAAGSVRSAKDSISSLIEDTWNEYTGDKNNLLNMDAGASAVSLTSAQNASPSSVQVLIRTQEIKEEEPASPEAAAEKADGGTFWSRVGAMFQGIGSDVAGLFRR